MSKRILIDRDLSTKDSFLRELSAVRDKGFISTHRAGPTGIGKTLEDELGISENSISSPDLGTIELKTARINSNSMLTLTTKAPEIRGVNTYLRRNFGYKTEESVKLNPELNILHSTINGVGFNTLNGHPYFKLTFKDGRVYLEHATAGIIENVYWNESTLAYAFKRKYPFEKLYYVKANAENINGREAFHYIEAYFLETFSSEKMLGSIRFGVLDIDIRLGIYTKGKMKGKAHDHGSAIRIMPNKLELCFEKSERIM